MKKNLLTSLWFTLVTTMICGVIYPLAVTVLAQSLFRDKANGQLIERNGKIVGSKIIGQNFTAASYFRSRPSSAGTGYDAASSSGSNFGPTNKILLDRVNADVEKAQAENRSASVPVDLVTASGSGLDPDISPASAEFQIPRVARERHMAESDLRALVARYTQPRQFDVLGEPRVNVLQLNLTLDASHPLQ
jgi:K+-transporting ATPase ATPase C chain